METDEIRELAETSARAKSNTKRIDKLEERQDNLDKLAAGLATMDSEQKHIKQDVTEIKADVKALADKPGKRWESVIDKVIWLIVGGLIAMAANAIGLNF